MFHDARRLAGILLVAGWGMTAVAEELFPPELTRWEPLATEPVFHGAGAGAWDARLRERGWIHREGDQWRLWYTGYDGERTGLKMLGLATSHDGLTWTRAPGNPLYREHWVEDVCVVQHEGAYHLFAEGFLDRLHRLVSTDGLTWERRGLVDVRLTSGAPLPPGPYGTPAVWVEGGVWHLFYERRDLGIWLATSTDLKVWTHVQDEPVMHPGPAEYDRDLIAVNQILKYRGRYYAVYHGASRARNPALWATGLAVSDDLRRWTKYPGNPLRPISENKSSGQLLPVGDGFRLYTVHEKVQVHGPATSR